MASVDENWYTSRDSDTTTERNRPNEYHVQRPIGRPFTVVANIVVWPSTCIHGRVLL